MTKLLTLLTAAWLGLLPALVPAAQDVASALVKDTSERMLEALEKRRVEIDRQPQIIYQLVDNIVVPQFDFHRITQFAVGRHWLKATPDQQQALIEEFQEMLVRTYAKTLLSYAGQDVKYRPLRPGSNPTDVMVSTEVREPGGSPISINYRLYLKDDAWKVYDLSIDGVSLVANYRSSFSAQIRRGGIDQLIKRLQLQNRQGTE